MPKRAREADWRTPLFFWRGTLTLAAADQRSSESGGAARSGGGGTGGGAAHSERADAELVWEGAWVSASLEEGLPADGAFASSPCTFRCAAPLLLPAGAPLSVDALAGAVLTLSASTYLLDNGEGLQRFNDETHHIAFDVPPPGGAGALLVGGQGTTEFGRFVSIGMAEAEEGGELKLTLARRYLDSGDARLSWRGGAGALEGCAAGVPRSELLRGPWASLPWRVAAERRASSKRDKSVNVEKA